MKLMHLSDLHLGKRLNEFSLLEDQTYILRQICDAAAREKPDAVIIAGDVYDKTVPPAEAVELFDSFLVYLSELGKPVFIISGNHDSAERIAFGGRLMRRSGVYLAPVYDGNVEPIRLEDEYGAVNIYMLPFVKPAHVRRWFPDAGIENYTDAVAAAVEVMNIDTSKRNVLVTHQFVTGAQRCESEDISVGGTDSVSAGVLDSFDYVALGHLHSAQTLGGKMRYCGTPLKYSFSEARQQKSITMAVLGEKGRLSIDTIPLKPLRELTELRGSYMELTARDFYADTDWRTDYTHITLTDEEDIPDAVGKLRVIYKGLMKLDYDNRRTRESLTLTAAENTEERSPLELFGELYEKQNNAPMSNEQRAYTAELIEKIWGEQQ
ncbi:MAG: exonuclease SbcCD subunit D [Candidatus Heteroscillospira sp.]|jgi:exonuclease SbcD